MNRTAIFPVLLLLSACVASASDYPSLLPRPIESGSFAEPVRATAVATPDPALDTRVATLSDRVAEAARAFDAAVAQARPAVNAAARSAEGSDAWLGAQVRLAQLDVTRAEIDAPVADLEQMTIDRAAAGQPPYPALDAALDRAKTAAAAQRATITALSATLR